MPTLSTSNVVALITFAPLSDDAVPVLSKETTEAIVEEKLTAHKPKNDNDSPVASPKDVVKSSSLPDENSSSVEHGGKGALIRYTLLPIFS